jgi:hypothetical protein
MRERECEEKKRNLLKKEILIVTNNYLLREKHNIKFIRKIKCVKKNTISIRP